MFANGGTQYADAVHLILVDPAGRKLSLELKGPAIAPGRIDPFILPLPKGAGFTLAVDLIHYAAPRERVWELRLIPGNYRLQAEYGVTVSQSHASLDMQCIDLLRLWKGQLTSNPIYFKVDKGTP